MSFTDRLPRGARESWRYDVIAPTNGLGEALARFNNHEAAFLDLDIMHDWYRFLLRLVPNLDGLRQDPDHRGVFHIGGNALGILLDEDGQETGRHFVVSGWLEGATTHRGLIVGKISLEKMSTDIPEAS